MGLLLQPGLCYQLWAVRRLSLLKTKMDRSKGAEEGFSPVLHIADKWHWMSAFLIPSHWAQITSAEISSGFFTTVFSLSVTEVLVLKSMKL